MWNLKYGTNETEMRLTDIKNRRVVPEAEGRWGRDELRLGGEQIEAVPHRMNKQKGLLYRGRELYSLSCDKPSWKRI